MYLVVRVDEVVIAHVIIASLECGLVVFLSANLIILVCDHSPWDVQ